MSGMLYDPIFQKITFCAFIPPFYGDTLLFRFSPSLLLSLFLFFPPSLSLSFFVPSSSSLFLSHSLFLDVSFSHYDNSPSLSLSFPLLSRHLSPQGPGKLGLHVRTFAAVYLHTAESPV